MSGFWLLIHPSTAFFDRKLKRCSSSISTIVSPSFWTLIEVLRKPSLTKHLANEIPQYYSARSAEYDVAGLASMPLLQSIHKEIERLRVAFYLVQEVAIDDCRLDSQWKLPKNASAVAFSHDVAMNTAEWAKARPRTVERPLEEFWAERFLILDRTTSHPRKDQPKSEKVETGRFSMHGIEHLDLASSSDHYASLGQDFAKAVQTATLAIFLTEFELQLCDLEAVDAAMPPVRETAFGEVRVLDKVAVRIRKRGTREKR